MYKSQKAFGQKQKNSQILASVFVFQVQAPLMFLELNSDPKSLAGGPSDSPGPAPDP